MEAGYRVLAGGEVPFALAVHIVLIGVLILSVVTSWPGAHGRDARRGSTHLATLGVAVLGLVLVVAFHASLSHLLVSAYFPEGRARFYPALLLLLALTSGAILAFRRLREFDPRIAVVAGTTFVIVVLVGAAIPSAGADITEYRQAKLMTLVKRQAYEEVVRLHSSSGADRFRLSRCPPVLDAPWGFAAYFAWRGHPEINVLLEGDGDSGKALEGGPRTVVDCRVPVLAPWPGRGAVRAAGPVRRIQFVEGQLLGGFAYDFWVPPTVSHCSVRGRYNPNAGGSPLYEESFVYELSFGTGYAGEPVRIIDAREVSAVRWSSARSTVGYAQSGDVSKAVPLAAFDAEDWQSRPYVRVLVTGLGPGWVTDYADVRMNCDDV